MRTKLNPDYGLIQPDESNESIYELRVIKYPKCGGSTSSNECTVGLWEPFDLGPVGYFVTVEISIKDNGDFYNNYNKVTFSYLQI